MTHRLTTDCAKNYCNRTLIVKVIAENVVTCFLLGHSVELHKQWIEQWYVTKNGLQSDLSRNTLDIRRLSSFSLPGIQVLLVNQVGI